MFGQTRAHLCILAGQNFFISTLDWVKSIYSILVNVYIRTFGRRFIQNKFKFCLFLKQFIIK